MCSTIGIEVEIKFEAPKVTDLGNERISSVQGASITNNGSIILEKALPPDIHFFFDEIVQPLVEAGDARFVAAGELRSLGCDFKRRSLVGLFRGLPVHGQLLAEQRSGSRYRWNARWHCRWRGYRRERIAGKD